MKVGCSKEDTGGGLADRRWERRGGGKRRQPPATLWKMEVFIVAFQEIWTAVRGVKPLDLCRKPSVK